MIWYLAIVAAALLFFRGLGRGNNPRDPNTHLGPDDMDQLSGWHVKGRTPAKRYRA